MKNKSPRTWLASLLVALVGCLFITVTGWLFATPAEDISTAVISSGAQDVRSAPSDSFLNAFSSVLTSTDDDQSAAYVAAAKNMRPDLSTQIDTAASTVETGPSDNDPNERRRVSRHRRRVPICCRRYHHPHHANDSDNETEVDRGHHRGGQYHTIFVPRSKAQQFLATHPQCRPGTCASRWHNPES